MKVLVVGAGPAGLLMANFLIRRQDQTYHVHIVEGQGDPRQAALNTEGLTAESDFESPPSYPISLQSRGMNALEGIPGLSQAIQDQGFMARGACFHSNDSGRSQKIPLDPPKLFCNHAQMTRTLLDFLENHEHVNNNNSNQLTIDFDCKLQTVDLDKKTITMTRASDDANDKQQHQEHTTTTTTAFDVLVAADGAKSTVRHQLIAHKGLLQAEETMIADKYKTISLTSTSATDDEQLEKDWVHGWILKNKEDVGLRVIAASFPNNESRLNGALVFENDPTRKCKSPQDVQAVFERLSPQSLAKFVTRDEYCRLLTRPTHSLVRVKCNALHVEDKVLLIGDAAHAMSQTVGHGCISAFQDVQVFVQMLDDYRDDWQQALPAYSRERLEDVHALYEMDMATPQTKWLKLELMIRQLCRKLLPSFLVNALLLKEQPLPSELLSDTTLSYREVLKQSGWWIDRVKRSNDSL